ncbi:hypothetical protein FRC00_005472, partial [Tulasnella sp. 408]
PFMTNGNIDQYLEKTSSLVSDNLRLKLLRDSLSGLVYLHSLNPPICHADIKPENILITDEITAVLCDFGLARRADGKPSGLTTTKTIKGSTRYMSPELLEEDGVQTLRSDIWAYGCLVFKVMTGSLPYGSANSDQQILLALALKQPPTGLAEPNLRDERLKLLLMKCWDLTPARRPSAAKCLFYIPKPKIIEPKLPGTRFNSFRSSRQHVRHSNRSPPSAGDRISVSGTSFLMLAEPSSKVLPPLPEAPEIDEAVSASFLPHFGHADHSRSEVLATSHLLGKQAPPTNKLHITPAPPYRFESSIQVAVDPSAAQHTPYFTDSPAGSVPLKVADSPPDPFGRADSSKVETTSKTEATRRQRPPPPATDRPFLLQGSNNITEIPWSAASRSAPLGLPPIANAATAPRKSSTPKDPKRGILSSISDIFVKR